MNEQTPSLMLCFDLIRVDLGYDDGSINPAFPCLPLSSILDCYGCVCPVCIFEAVISSLLPYSTLVCVTKFPAVDISLEDRKIL